LPSTTSGSHTVDSDTTPMNRSWGIATNIRQSAENIVSRLGQATISKLEAGYERVLSRRH
jgi:hypothetical protein